MCSKFWFLWWCRCVDTRTTTRAATVCLNWILAVWFACDRLRIHHDNTDFGVCNEYIDGMRYVNVSIFNVIRHHLSMSISFAWICTLDRGHGKTKQTNNTHEWENVEARGSTVNATLSMKYVRFRLSILDCIQFGTGGHSLPGTIRCLIDDHVRRFHSAQVNETSRISMEIDIRTEKTQIIFFFFSVRCQFTLPGWSICRGWCMRMRQWRLFSGRAYKI